MKKSLLFIFLIFISLFAITLSSCDGEEAAETTANETIAEVEETEPIPQTLKFSESGKCSFISFTPSTLTRISRI